MTEVKRQVPLIKIYSSQLFSSNKAIIVSLTTHQLKLYILLIIKEIIPANQRRIVFTDSLYANVPYKYANSGLIKISRSYFRQRIWAVLKNNELSSFYDHVLFKTKPLFSIFIFHSQPKKEKCFSWKTIQLTLFIKLNASLWQMKKRRFGSFTTTQLATTKISCNLGLYIIKEVSQPNKNKH